MAFKPDAYMKAIPLKKEQGLNKNLTVGKLFRPYPKTRNVESSPRLETLEPSPSQASGEQMKPVGFAPQVTVNN